MQKDFWNTDLEDIEKVFLKKGQKITDLPVIIDSRVPAQGVILPVINIDKIIPKITLFQKIKFYFKLYISRV